MDSEKLSQRTRQLGHDRTFRTSETNFVEAARRCLDPERYEVADRPRDLLECFGTEVGLRALGLQPEASITSRQFSSPASLGGLRPGENWGMMRGVVR